MTNYNPNANLTANTTGWTASAGTLTASADYGKIVSSGATQLRSPISDYLPSNTPINLLGVGLRRNANGGQPRFLSLICSNGATDAVMYTFDLTDVIFPVGQWIRLPMSGYFARVGPGTRRWWTTLRMDGPINFNLREFYYFDDATAAQEALGIPDTSDASWTATPPNNSLTVPFSHANPDEMVDRLRWDWGHGGSATDGPAVSTRTPSHTFPTAGSYSVKLTAYNDQQGYSAAVTKAVVVPSGAYTASYVWDSDYLTANVDGRESVGAVINTYTWDWGDGTPTTTGALTSHDYAQGGTYNVKLTISNTLGQSNSVTKQVTVTDPPSPDLYFTTRRDLLAVEFFPSLVGQPAYSWSFGDGGTSTAQTPTHTYATPGTYEVTLTVGAYTTTQTLVAYDAYRPLKNLSDALRLEVEIPPTESAAYNRVPNPSGRLGAFGWSTPVADAEVFSSPDATGTEDHGFSGWKLGYRSSGVGDQTFYSAPVKVTVGRYVAAALTTLYDDGYYRLALEALNAAGAVVGTSVETGYLTAPGSPHRTGAWQVPAGAATVRLRVHFTSDTGSGVPAAGKLILWRRTMLAMAVTSAELANLVYAEDANWLDVLGPTSEVKIKREPLDLSSFSAVVRDASLDPANSSALRPGQGVRFRVATEDDAGGVTYEPLYTGRLTSGKVTYDRDKNRRPRTIITLAATDVVTDLAGLPEPRGVGAIADLPELLEGQSVPYLVNGSAGQIPAAQIVSSNDDATLLDQVALARDTDSGYAHVSRDGVLVVNDRVAVPVAIRGVLDGKAYSDVDADYDFSECINSVTIKWLRYNSQSGDTTEVLYGPYEDLDSIEEFGPHPETFTMQGAVENETAIAARGAEILAANAVPQRRVNSVTVPIRYQDDLVRGKALLDLYDLVQVVHDDTATDQALRITTLEHTITPKRWTMEVGFNSDGSVARPAAIPSPVTYAVVAGLAVEIPNTADLNSYVRPGKYAQSSNVEAAAGTNYPVPLAGLLEVDANTAGNMVWQRYTVYSGGATYGGQVFVRSSYNGTWIPWQGMSGGGGWVNLTMGDTSMVPYDGAGGGYAQPQYKVSGRTVKLRGMIRNNLARTASTTIATVPSSFAPQETEIFNQAGSPTVTSSGSSAASSGSTTPSGGAAHTHTIAHTHTVPIQALRVDVQSTGLITCAPSATNPLPAGSYVSLSGITWDLD